MKGMNSKKRKEKNEEMQKQTPNIDKRTEGEQSVG